MSDMAWRAEGIANARAAGGLDLDVYRRPGFVRALGVRVAGGGSWAGGFDVEPDDNMTNPANTSNNLKVSKIPGGY